MIGCVGAGRIGITILLLVHSCCLAGAQPCTNAVEDPISLTQAAQYLSVGDHEKALRCCDALMTRRGPEYRAALKMKGDCLCQLKRYAEAAQCWEKVLKCRQMLEVDDDVALRLAELYAYTLGETNKAEKLYRAMFARHPPSPRLPLARYQYAGMLYKGGDYANAALLLADFVREYPQSPYMPQATNYLAVCGKILETQRQLEVARQSSAVLAAKASVAPPKPRSTQLFDKAESLFACKLYREALVLYRQVKNDAYCQEGRAAGYRLGQCHAALGESTLAIRQWEETAGAIRRDTNTTWAAESLKALGDIHFDVLCDPKSALGAYRRLVETYPGSPLVPGTLKQIGLVYLHEDRRMEAKAIFEELLRARPQPDVEAPPSELDRLIAYCDGRHDGRLPVIRAAGNPRLAAGMRRADLYFLAKDYERALDAYKSVERRGRGSEDGAYALFQAGRCENQLRRYPEALRCFKRFLEDYRESRWADDALVRACVIYVGPLNDPASGAKMCETVLRDHPGGDEADIALAHLATLAYWRKDWKGAKTLHERLLNDYPKSRYVRVIQQVRLPEIERQLKLAVDKGKGTT